MKMSEQQRRLGELRTLMRETQNAMNYVTPNHEIEAFVSTGPQGSSVVQFYAHEKAKAGGGYIEGTEIADAFKVEAHRFTDPGPGLFTNWVKGEFRDLMERYGVLCYKLGVEKDEGQ
jgi:hypothetical protein